MYTADFFDSLLNCIKGTDKKMKKGGFGKNKPVLITIVALVVLAAMILASAGRGTANWFENAVGAVLTPVQGFAALVRVLSSMMHSSGNPMTKLR